METRRYFGCRMTQRNNSKTTPFFVFILRIKDLKEWVGIRRTVESPSGTQRVLKPTRSRAITRFLKATSINTIPNNVLIAFEPRKAKFISLEEDLNTCLSDTNTHNGCDGQMEWGFLSFSFKLNQPDHLRPALIVDGQHRIYGISSFEDEDLPVLVVSLLNASDQEQAFQFIVVNDKAVKVATENVKSIIADFDALKLQERLFLAGIKYGDTSPQLRDINDLQTSPFRNLLDWSYNRKGEKLVPLTAIEQGLKYLHSVFANVLANDENSETEIFCAMWRGAQSRFPDLWGRSNKFMTKVNLNALNELMVHRLKTLWTIDQLDVFELESVEAKICEMLTPMSEEFWTVEWTAPPQDTAGFREVIKEDLEKMLENVRLRKPWSNDLQLPVDAD